MGGSRETGASTVVGVVGFSNSGKTLLIEALVREFKRRGRTVATVKHCPHGFDLDRPGKDSHRHMEAGADAVILSGPGAVGVVRRDVDGEAPLHDLLARYAAGYDLVLVEGYRDMGIPQIVVRAPGMAEFPAAAVAVVDSGQVTDRAALPSVVARVADLIERLERA